MSLGRYVEGLLAKLGGSALYALSLAAVALFIHFIPQIPNYGIMALGVLAHVAGARAYWYVTNPR